MNDNETRPVPPIPPIEAETVTPMPTIEELQMQVRELAVTTAAKFEVIDARFAAMLSPQQITDMIHAAIKQAAAEFDNAIARIETIGNDISSNFAGNQMIVGRLDILQPQVMEMVTAFNHRVAELQKMNGHLETQNARLETLASAVNIMAGYDVEHPDSKKLGGISVIQVASTALEKSTQAVLDVSEARRDFVAMSNQATGLKAELQATNSKIAALDTTLNNVNTRLATSEANDRQWQEIRQLAYKAVTSQSFIRIVATIFGGGSFAAIAKLLGIF